MIGSRPRSHLINIMSIFSRKTSMVWQYVCENCGTFLTNDEKTALMRGTLFVMLVTHLFLPLVTKLRQIVLNDPVSTGSGAYNIASPVPHKITVAHDQFILQEDYYSVEYACWMALLIAIVINQADLILVNFRHPYLRQTTMHTYVVTFKKFFMGAVVLTSIHGLIISWMRTRSCDTVIMLPWRMFFNPCAVSTELITIFKFVLSILAFSSLVSKYPTTFGHILHKRSLYGLGHEEIFLFLVVAGSLEAVKICNGMAVLTRNSSYAFAGVVILWNIVSMLWNMITPAKMCVQQWINYMDFTLVGGPNQRIASDQLNSDLSSPVPKDCIRLPVTEDEGKRSLIISEKKDELSLVATFDLVKAHQIDSLNLRLINDEYTSLALLKIKKMACPKNTNYEIFEKNGIEKLYSALSKSFEPLYKEDFAIDLYKKNDLGIEVGSFEGYSFIIRLEDILDKDHGITGIYIDVKHTDDGPACTTQFYEMVDWPSLSTEIKNLFKHLDKILHNETPAADGRNDR